ncbi:hypothetical protein HMPREF1624_06423 [Sporothrix schenckii ATCC 58251]|uniref:Thioredoxin reductase n=1 Tax=Sporothrix schenckii (strain ATCC 58251 / de Perez 2211183) TaxID=1391915 RepID=U7PQT1_SPOS1|nr:hypothetical protein HMPREF1624_06423 [Sporothrix schenckii ATCC 58251]
MRTEDLEALVASIAQALNAFGIPCVLWGHCLLQVHGVPTILGSIDYAIPDDALTAGSRALLGITLAQDALLAPCPDRSSCDILAPNRPSPAPSFHVHLKDDTEVGVGLYLQRDTLWFLPPFQSTGVRARLLAPRVDSLPAPFLLATDATALPPWRPSRGSGVFTSGDGKGPVVVVKSHVLLEALMRILARDDGTSAGSFSLAIITYMEMYVDGDGFLDARQLPDDVRALYEQRRNRSKPLRQWKWEVKRYFGPGPAPFVAITD